jgi:hypothetical protein
MNYAYSITAKDIIPMLLAKVDNIESYTVLALFSCLALISSSI